jgi:hypothetical protein
MQKSSYQVLAVIFCWGAYAKMVEELQLANRVSTDPHLARSIGLIAALLIAICGETKARGFLSTVLGASESYSHGTARLD